MTEREALKLALGTFKLIAAQDQGCGGNVNEEEAWQSAKTIALSTISIMEEALAQPEQSQVEETLRYEIDALEAKLAECRAQPEQEPVCWKHYDEPKKGCAWCDKQPAQQEHVATSDTSEKRVDEMAKQRHEPVAYGMWDTMLGKGHRMMMVRLDKGQDGCTVPLYPPPQPESVIDNSAAVRIATALGWEPKRKPLTEKEIDQITEQLDETTIGWSTHEFARAIEAARGIKE